jgi:ABC-type branched-subunit amino acid transport system substrate-binding protein
MARQMGACTARAGGGTGDIYVKRTLAVLICAVALLGASCGASGDETGQEDENVTETTAGGGNGAEKWGDLDSPCGEGDATVADGEGPATDRLVLGVANDRTGIRPGLNAEFWDAARAYAEWCNAQGGIEGLPIELVDLDGSVVEVEAAMTKACTGVFAMVGGGYALDNLEFSGKDGSDFHRCGLIDVPGFAVSVEKSLSNGHVQPIPNPANAKGTQWIADFKELYPEESSKNVVVYSKDLPSLEAIKVQWDVLTEEVGGIEQLPPVTYGLVVTDWGPYADRIIASGATSLFWIGEPGNAANLMRVLTEKQWDGVFISEANTYDDVFLETAGAAAEGAVVRMIFHPFEEADRVPAIQQYLDNLERHVPGGKAALLGMQGTSAFLLFSVAAKTCAQENDGVIDRACILREAEAIEGWTAGGMHAESDPGVDTPPECGMLVTVRDGKWTRLYPEIGGDGDDGDGFHCPADSIVTIPDDRVPGEGVVDPDRED